MRARLPLAYCVAAAIVIPCAVQRQAVRRRHGIFCGLPLQDPVSAQQHFMLQRARDDGRKLINRIRY
jgi:hypothetical protein